MKYLYCLVVVSVGMCLLMADVSFAAQASTSGNNVSVKPSGSEPDKPMAKPMESSVPLTADSVSDQKTSVSSTKPPAFPSSLQPMPKPKPGDEYYFYNAYLAYKLAIGNRIRNITLLDDTRGQPNNGSFFGTVTQMRVDQEYLALMNIFAEYRIIPQFGAGIAYDSFSADVGDWGVTAGGGGSDGTLKMSGPLFYVFGRYPNTTRFTPFCELGLAMYSASFDASAEWGESGLRHVSLSGTTGYYLAIGCDMHVHDYVLIDIYGRYMQISDVNGEWYTGSLRLGDVALTPSYMSIGIGAKFLF